MRERVATTLMDAGLWDLWLPNHYLRGTLTEIAGPGLAQALDDAEDEHFITIPILGSDLIGSRRLGDLAYGRSHSRWVEQLIWGSKEN